MSDPKQIEELEAELARDEERLREIERIETQLLRNIPHDGFHTATDELQLRIEKKMLADAIRKNSILLAVAKR
jgi:hypothetical protein